MHADYGRCWLCWINPGYCPHTAVPYVRLIALDNLHRRGSELNLPRLARAGVRFVHGDIRSLEDLLALLPEAPGLVFSVRQNPRPRQATEDHLSM